MAYLDHTAYEAAGNPGTATASLAEYLDVFRRLASQGDDNALFTLGCAYSTGSHGVDCDMVEAHKWFNLAASRGHEDAPHCRSEVAEEMTRAEIAEAQKRARAWLSRRV